MGAQGPAGPAGPAGPQGPQGVPGPTSIAACPGGYTTIQLPSSTLCIYNDTFSSTWPSGQNWCENLFGGANVCTYEQIRKACNGFGYVIPADRWLGDRTADDEVLFTNGTSCGNFDGVANAINTTKPGTLCCLEWMKY
jgi:hypothetical protein